MTETFNYTVGRISFTAFHPSVLYVIKKKEEKKKLGYRMFNRLSGGGATELLIYNKARLKGMSFATPISGADEAEVSFYLRFLIVY